MTKAGPAPPAAPAHRRAGRLIAAVMVPPLALAAAGCVHPIYLTNTSGMRWHDLHVLLLPVFPLLGLGPWLLGRRHGRVLGWTTGFLGYVYATFYSGLDVLAGIGAGALQQRHLGGTFTLFAQGDDLARIGTWAYLAATVLTAGAACHTRRPRSAATVTSTAAGTVLVLAGAWTFRTSHIFWPRGVLAMLALAAGWTALAAVTPRSAPLHHSH